MNRRLLIIIVLTLTALVAESQQPDTINITDSKGMKQGHWIKKYPDGTIQYDGYFRNDSPVGEFRRFYETGVLKSLMFYTEGSNEVKVKFYHPNGFPAAEGLYIDQKKEGIWKYYSQNTENYLICEEYYRNDLRNGTSQKYYKDGKIAEKLSYTDDIRHGEWTQYYVTGKLCIKGNYVSGKLSGSFEVYYANGNPEYIGQYREDARDGLWKIYKEDGTVDIELAYKMGALDDPRIAERENAFLDLLEKNRGKLTDP
jgi:antitoxin component YwqK of YwqJK toxin-antitoxin module